MIDYSESDHMIIRWMLSTRIFFQYSKFLKVTFLLPTKKLEWQRKNLIDNIFFSGNRLIQINISVPIVSCSLFFTVWFDLISKTNNNLISSETIQFSNAVKTEKWQVLVLITLIAHSHVKCQCDIWKWRRVVNNNKII